MAEPRTVAASVVEQEVAEELERAVQQVVFSDSKEYSEGAQRRRRRPPWGEGAAWHPGSR